MRASVLFSDNLKSRSIMTRVSAAHSICRHKSLSIWQCAIRCESKSRNYSKIPNLMALNDFVNVVATGLWPVQLCAAL